MRLEDKIGRLQKSILSGRTPEKGGTGMSVMKQASPSKGWLMPLFQVNVHQMATGQHYNSLMNLAPDTEGICQILCEKSPYRCHNMDTDRLMRL
jgi:hypothetical protein